MKRLMILMLALPLASHAVQVCDLAGEHVNLNEYEFLQIYLVQIIPEGTPNRREHRRPVTDTLAGGPPRIYRNSLGQFGSFGDIEAFPAP